MPFRTPSSPSAPPSPSTATPPDPARAGAVWVTGTGAFLLIAAATVFVCTRWSTFPDEVKFAVLATVTGGCLLAGRRLRPVLPATAGVLFHLGALLLPVNVAALLVDVEATWPQHLVVQGAVAAVAFTLLARTEDSVVLRAGAATGVVVFAAGAATTLGVSAALVLVGFALLASLLGRRRLAATWAAVAGLAPLLALAERFVAVPTPVIQELGLVGRSNRLVAVVVGIAAALVIGRLAAERDSVALVAVAGTVGAAGLATTWVELDPTASVTWTGAAALFVLVELAALLLASDPFWWRPAKALGAASEAIVGAILAGSTLWAVGELGYRAGRDLAPSFEPPLLVAAGLGALGWLLADLRRRAADTTPRGIALLVGAGWWPASLGLTASVLSGVLLGGQSLAWSGVAVASLAAFFVVSGRPLGHGLAVVLATVAPAFAAGDTWLVALLAAVGAATIAGAAIVRSGLLSADAVEESLALSGCSPLPIITGASVAAASLPAAPVLFAATAAAWLTGVLVDRAARHSAPSWVGWLPRGVAVSALAFGWLLTPTQLAVLAGALTIAVVVDAVRLDQPGLLVAVDLTLPVAIAGAVRAGGGSWATVGIAWCVVALVGVGADRLVPRRWELPVLSSIVILGAGGLLLTSAHPGALGGALILLGGAASALALGRHQRDLAFVGAVVATAGIWLELSSRHVAALDAYAAPVAAVLLLAGLAARHRPVAPVDAARADLDVSRPGSWVAYAPAVATIGGAALVERATTGGSVHALIAGAVGLLAVVAGGSRRLAGPLFVGTVLVVAATVMESVHAAAGVPTPVWLALGGTSLVAAGIAMERHDTGPFETGRRVVDVIQERFS